MHERDGENYFVVDSHLHSCDASRAHSVSGQERYARG
jgi:uncharacterized protein